MISPLAPFLAAALVAPTALPHDGHLPSGFETVDVPAFFGIPVAFVFAPDGAILVAEKDGRVAFLADPHSPPQATSLIDLTDEISSAGDRGLLSIALHPGWVADGGPTSWIYLLYSVSPVFASDPPSGENQQFAFGRLTRYRVGTQGGEVLADLASREVLLGTMLPSGAVPDGIAWPKDLHTCGSLAFGSDGSLLVATGDGADSNFADTGGGVDPAFDDFTHPVTGLVGPFAKFEDIGSMRAQDLRSLAGKVLRVDPATGQGYASNPFFDGDPASNPSRVWALGLRMPFRMGLDPASGSADPADGAPGRLWVGDVGWGKFEELERCESGENFGWPCWEGLNTNPEFTAWQAGPGGVDCSIVPPGVLTNPEIGWHHFDAAQMTPQVHVDAGGAPDVGIVGECAIGGPVYAGGNYPVEYDGRVFFGDFVGGWIRTLEVDSGGNPVAVRDFAHELDPIVDIQLDPVSGDVFFLTLKGAEPPKLRRFRFASSLTPIALAAAAPLSGDAPLAVTFDGNGSVELDGQTLTYSWDFGDGSPPVSGPAPSHVYDEDGMYVAELTVTDPDLLSSSDSVVISVGNVAPQAVLVSPTPNQTYVPGEVIPLVGAGVDPQGGSLAYTWVVDLVHDTHIHPGQLVASGPTASLHTADHGSPGDLTYYRVELQVTDGQSFTGRSHTYVYPVQKLADPTGTATPIAKVFELSPPGPMGGGSPDLEVVRDDVWPSPSLYEPAPQFDSFHFGAQNGDDWIGYEWSGGFGPETVFIGLDFQEGLHYPAGGWWETLGVEVRQGGAWLPATNLRVSPDYPFDLATTPFFDATPFDVYRLTFDPLTGDAVRLRGDPGGVMDFMSAAELRAIVARPDPPFEPYADLTAQGTFVARVLAQAPPGPQGTANDDPELLRNGTWPPVGSASAHAQYATAHPAAPTGDDWLGWEFDGPRTFARVRFQEGLHQADGGWFAALGVEVRDHATQTWAPVTGLVSTPPYTPSSAPTSSYRTFELTFAPTVGDAVRVVGPPAGTAGYVSAGELRVDEPAFSDGVCGIVPAGLGLGGANVLSLTADTVAIPGELLALEVAGALPLSFGAMVVAEGGATIPLTGGTLLVDPGQLVLVDLVSFDGEGHGVWTVTLPNGPSMDHFELMFQAAGLDQAMPDGFRLSNALSVTSCNWP